MEPHCTFNYPDHQHQLPLVNNTPQYNPQQPQYQSAPGCSDLLQKQLRSFWETQYQESKQGNVDFGNHSLPLARIKKIMKSDNNVRMISADAPVLFARACEMFIQDLTLRSWCCTEESKRKTLQKADISAALSTTDLFDFLVDLVPREKPLIPTIPPTNPGTISFMDNAGSSLGVVPDQQHLQQCYSLGDQAAGLTMGLQMQVVQNEQVDHGGYNSSKYIQGGWPNYLGYQRAWPPPEF